MQHDCACTSLVLSISNLVHVFRLWFISLWPQFTFITRVHYVHLEIMAPKASTPSKRVAELGIDALTPSPPAKRSSFARNTTMKAQRIRDMQLKDMTDHEFDCLLIMGQTCRAKVEHDIDLKQQGISIVMGKHYYQGIRETWTARENAQSRLRVINNHEPFPEGWTAACEAINGTPRNWQPMMSWLFAFDPKDGINPEEPINQRTFVTMCQRMLKHPVGINSSNNAFNFACVQFISRHSLHLQYANEWQHMQTHVNILLKNHLQAAQKGGVNTSQWWECHSKTAATITNKTSVDKIMAMKDGESWTPLDLEVTSVHASGAFGAHLVQGPYCKVQHEKFLASLQTHLDMFKDKDLTMDLYNHVRVLYINELTAKGINPMDPIAGGESMATYRGDAYVIHVSSRLDAFIKAFKALAYSIGVENKQLPPIWEENSLMRGDPSLRNLKVEDVIIKDQLMARKCAIQAMTMQADDMTSEVLRSIMVSQKDHQTSIDPYWNVMYGAFESIVGQNSHARFMSLVHHRLPTAGRMTTPEHSLSELNSLADMKAMKFMPTSCQAQLRAIRHAVDMIIQRKRADMPCDGTSSMTQMATKMGLWLHIEKNGETIRGKRAMEAIYSDLLDMETSSRMDEMTLAMLEPCQTFNWLLTAAMETKVAAWTSTIMGRNRQH